MGRGGWESLALENSFSWFMKDLMEGLWVIVTDEINIKIYMDEANRIYQANEQSDKIKPHFLYKVWPSRWPRIFEPFRPSLSVTDLFPLFQLCFVVRLCSLKIAIFFVSSCWSFQSWSRVFICLE